MRPVLQNSLWFCLCCLLFLRVLRGFISASPLVSDRIQHCFLSTLRSSIQFRKSPTLQWPPLGCQGLNKGLVPFFIELQGSGFCGDLLRLDCVASIGIVKDLLHAMKISRNNYPFCVCDLDSWPRSEQATHGDILDD